MGFYIRKSISAGPFRFNLSKSGLGLSVGVKGLRVGIGPRGHYIHAGAGGFYYRASLGGAGERRNQQAPPSRKHSPEPQPVFHQDSLEVEMIDIDSGDVLEMRDERFQDLLDEINTKQAQQRMSRILGWCGIICSAITAVVAPPAFLPITVIALVAYLFGRWYDSYNRVSVLFYNLEEETFKAYKDVVETFGLLAGCSRAWHIPSAGAVKDLTNWKRNAGAKYLLERKSIVLSSKSPSVICSNIDAPCIPVGTQTLYFFPDKLLVFDGQKIGAVNYDKLRIRVEDSNFIEDENVPDDSKVLTYTWKYPNKNGGPDRRFNDNRKIPVCAYESIHFSSDSGLNEVIQLSKRGFGLHFITSIRQLAELSTNIDQDTNDLIQTAPNTCSLLPSPRA